MKEIPLSRGMVALVSECDYERVSKFKWHACWDIGAKTFYAMRNVRRPDGSATKISMHRFILEFPVGLHVDHINHSTLDNRRENIRTATIAQNQFNRFKRRDNTTGFKGVGFQAGKWYAGIKVNRKRIHLGVFSTPEEAHAAYSEAAKRYHGEFSRAA